LDSLETSVRLVELVGAGILLVALLVATIRRSRRLPRLLAAAAVFGVVFLNPFGVAVTPTRDDPRPVTPVGTADTGVHWVKVLGVPVAWFVPYSKEYLYRGENSPTAALKLRYGLSFLPTTGAKTVASQCGSADVCWQDDYPLVQRDSRGRTWLVPLGQAPLGNVVGQAAYIHVPHFYAVRLGLGSVEGLIYWILLLGVAWVMLRGRHVRRRAIVPPAVAFVVAGVVLNLALAAAATPSRSASSREPQLVPKAPPVPRSSGRLTPTPISDRHYSDACMRQEGQTTLMLCRGADELAAAQTGDTVLAVWSVQPDPDSGTEFRVRRLSPSGRPLGPSRLLPRLWGDCPAPANLQAAPIPQGRVLLVWFDSCAGGSDLDAIVLDRRARLVRKPFVVAHVAPSYGSSGTGVPFWLRSTTSGRPLLVWTGSSRESAYGNGVFTAFLDRRLRVRRINEIVGKDELIGDIAVACSSRCIVARIIGTSVGTQPAATIDVDFLSATGAVAGRQYTSLGSPNLFSHPVAVAVRDRFYVGLLTTRRGSAATALVITIRRKDAAPSVARVWADVPAGEGSSPGIPDTLGIFGAARGAPTLAWQAGTSEGSTFVSKIYLADGRRRSSKTLATPLRERTFVGSDGTLIAVDSPGTPFPDPVSVQVPRP
jgi:hypothetical protein